MKRDYQIVTVSNRRPSEWYYLQDQFYASISRYGVDVLTINKQSEHPFNGLLTKPRWLYKAIKSGEIASKYIQFVDSWDLVYSAHPDEVMDCYDALGGDIVISAESNCFPETYKNDFDSLGLPMPYRYVNSGTIVGRTDAIMACLEAMDLPNLPDDYRLPEDGTNYHSNDQTEWQLLFLKQPVDINLDYRCMITQTLHNEVIDNFNFRREVIMNNTTRCFPRIWHFNGASKDKMELRQPILRHLNLL